MCVVFIRESVEGHYVPNAGFLEDVVFADPSVSFSSEASDSREVDAVEQQNGITSKEVSESNDVTDGHCDPSHTSSVVMKNDTAAQVAELVGDLKLGENNTTEELNVEDSHALSTEDLDTLLDKCLLQALHTTVKDKDLPMPGSTLW